MNTMFFGYYFGKLSIAVTDGAKPEKGDWNNIDETTLSDNQQILLSNYREAYKLAKDAKAMFEASVRREAGFTVPAKATKVPARKAMSLADYLDNAKANGRG